MQGSPSPAPPPVPSPVPWFQKGAWTNPVVGRSPAGVWAECPLSSTGRQSVPPLRHNPKGKPCKCFSHFLFQAVGAQGHTGRCLGKAGKVKHKLCFMPQVLLGKTKFAAKQVSTGIRLACVVYMLNVFKLQEEVTGKAREGTAYKEEEGRIRRIRRVGEVGHIR